MLFNSYRFWALYTVIIIVNKRLSHRNQNIFLLAASYFFYACWDWRFLFLMLFSTVLDFGVALAISHSNSPSHRKALLLVSLVVQLGLLGIFKYYNFFSHELNNVLTRSGLPDFLPAIHVILPVGISFYTFQTISYTIDVYRKEIPATRNFVDFALFVSFFPHLVAGPIVRARKLLPQISTPRVAQPEDFREGLYHVVLGLWKKVVIGDNMATIANVIFASKSSELSGVECLVGIYAFAFQIYGDFSGYSSIAQGIAKWLHIDLTTNFQMPYLATSPSDFWRRWHISLSQWFRDYVFIPLMHHEPTPTKWRWYTSAMIVMLLSGLWHGAAWTFVLWGLYHSLLLCAYKALSAGKELYLPQSRTESGTNAIASSSNIVGDTQRSDVKRPWLGLRVLQTLLMFHFVCFGWLLFRATSFGQVLDMSRLIVNDFRVTPYAISNLCQIAFFCIPMIVYECWVEKREDLSHLTRVHWMARGAAYTYCALMAWYFPPRVSNVFIYFQF